MFCCPCTQVVLVHVMAVPLMSALWEGMQGAPPFHVKLAYRTCPPGPQGPLEPSPAPPSAHARSPPRCHAWGDLNSKLLEAHFILRNIRSQRLVHCLLGLVTFPETMAADTAPAQPKSITDVKALLYRKLRVSDLHNHYCIMLANCARRRPVRGKTHHHDPTCCAALLAQVTLISDRVLEGDFACLDKQGNIILSNTFEQVTTASGGREERHMGLVLVPIQQQRKVELQVRNQGLTD